MKKDVIITGDLFCGAGGTSTGMADAIKDAGLHQIGFAINHWDVAVATMKKNHEDIDTKMMRAESAEPTVLAPGRVIHLLWASPSCTHHSRAKGGQPRQDQTRSQPHTIIPFLDQCKVYRIIVENVPEFVEWGPLDRNGHPIKRKKGLFFMLWVQELEARGYKVDWRVVNCADYGDPTTRKRLFIKAVLKGHGKISWPEPTHAELPEDNLFGKKLKRWRSIGECLDYSDIGRSIFNRPKPLAEKTMQRIADGLKRYCGIDLKPFLIKLRNHEMSASVDKPISTIVSHTVHHALCQPIIVEHTHNGKAVTVDAPLGTVTTKGHFSLIQAFAMDHFKGGKVFPVDKPIGAQTTHARYSMLTPIILGQQGGAECRPADKPCPTIATAAAIRVIMPFIVDNANGGIIRGADKPINTVTVKDQHMGVFPVLSDGRIIDIYIRMLRPDELAAAHSFPKGYVFTGTKTEQHKQIGNSVPVMTAKAMCAADIAQLKKSA